MLVNEETAASEAPIETKCCRRCGGVYDVTAFRPRRRGSEKRVAVCRFCRRIIDQARYKKSRDGAEQLAALQALTYLGSNRSLTRRLAFLDSAIDKFGGPVEFADAIHDVYATANDKRLKFKCLKAILDVALAPKKQTSF